MSFGEDIGAEVAEREVKTHPDAPERAAAAKRSSQCQACRRRGIFQVAHRVLANGDGVCNSCFREGRHLEEPIHHPSATLRAGSDTEPRRNAAKGQGPKMEDEEEAMAEQRVCGERGCGKALRVNNRSGFCTKHFYRPKQKRSGGGSAKPAGGERPAGGGLKRSRKMNGMATICVTEAALDRWWQQLAVEQKAEAFSSAMTQE